MWHNILHNGSPYTIQTAQLHSESMKKLSGLEDEKFACDAFIPEWYNYVQNGFGGFDQEGV